MKEELLAKVLQYLNSSEAFLKEQAPEFVQQYMAFVQWDLQFSIYTSSFAMAVGIVFLIAAFIYKDYDRAFVFFFVGFIMTIGGTIGLGCSYEQSKMLELAPKVFLIKNLKSELTGRCK